MPGRVSRHRPWSIRATGENRMAVHRNSEGMFFSLGETPLVAALDARFSRIMNLPVEHGEGLQVLRYGPGTHSSPHFDFLVPGNAANEESLRRSGQRVSSLVAYLNAVPAGGETAVSPPRPDGEPATRQCRLLRILQRPRPGRCGVAALGGAGDGGREVGGDQVDAANGLLSPATVKASGQAVPA